MKKECLEQPCRNIPNKIFIVMGYYKSKLFGMLPLSDGKKIDIRFSCSEHVYIIEKYSFYKEISSEEEYRKYLSLL